MKKASTRILSLLLALSLTAALIPLPVQAAETAADAPSDLQPSTTELQEDAEPAVSDESLASEDVSQAAVEPVPAGDLSQDAPEASEPVLADTADEAEEENEQTVFSGQCGDNATWTLDTEAKTLTISGTGAMFDYDDYGAAPWQENHDNYNAVETLTISEGITYIGAYNFSEMGNLCSLSLPSSLTSIGECAFFKSHMPSTLSLPEGLTSLDWAVFDSCTGLDKVILPSTLTDLGTYAFEYSDLSSVVFSEGIEVIPPCTFSNCKNLTSVALPNGLTTISEDAFRSTSLSSIELPSSLTRIDSHAFESTPLTSISIPDSLKYLGEYAFYNCRQLPSITLSDNVTSIGEKALGYYSDENGNSALISGFSISGYRGSAAANYAKENGITFHSLNGEDPTVFTGQCGDSATWTLDTEAKALTISGTGAMFDYNAYGEAPWQESRDKYNAVETLTISEGITHIGAYNFSKMGNLRTLSLPSSLLSIGERAFSESWISWGTLVLPEGLSSIGADAFEDCIDLKAVDLPSTLKTIGNGAFSYTNLTSVKIPKGVSEIGDYAFYFCNNLTSVTLPEGLQRIGSSAFGSNRFTSIQLPSTLKSIGEQAFMAVPLTSLTLPGGLETIGGLAFYDCTQLNSVTVPANVKTIGDMALGYCSDEDGDDILLPGFSISGYTGSAAEAYAKANNISFTYLDAPASLSTPVLKKAENVQGGVRVTWNAVDYAASYQVWRKVPGGKWAKVGKPVTGTGYTDTSVTSGTTYCYTVRAINGSVVSSYDKAGVSTLYLAVPVLKKAENSGTSIKLTWEKVPGAASYALYYSTNGGKSWKTLKTSKAVTGTSYTITGGTYGTVYTYTVRAVSGSTKSYYDKAGVSVMKLAVPKLTKAENTAEGITISWEPVTGATGYAVYYTKTAGKDWKLLGNVTDAKYTAKGGSSGVTYYYTVRATKGSYRSDYDRTGVSTMKLTIPKMLKAENTAKGITLTWEKVTGASSYALYYSINGGKSWKTLKTSKPVTGTSYTITGGSSGTVYTYTVRAVNSSSHSYYDKAGVSVMKLKTPTLGTVKTSSSGLTITWTAVAGAENYRIYRKIPGEKWKPIADTGKDQTSYLDKSASISSGYYYTVRAYTGKSISWYDEKGICFQLEQPELNSICNETEGITLDWFTVNGATGYRVYRKSGSSDWSLLKTVTATGSEEMMSYTDATAASGKLYSYTVRAVSGEMTSSYDKSGLSYYRLSTPVMNTPVLQDDGIKISWGKVTGANGYKVFRFVVDPESGERSSLEEIAWLTNRTDTIVEDYYPGYLNCYVVFAYYNNTYCSDVSDVAYCDFSDAD